ncbi:MAG: DUF3240 family protein [Planctomycetota bacterium]
MKCLTLFVHAAVAEACIDALRADPDLPGFTLTRCEGHSQRTESEAFVGARDRVVGYVPRARIELVLADQGEVERVLTRLRDVARAGQSWGTWMASDVNDFGRF